MKCCTHLYCHTPRHSQGMKPGMRCLRNTLRWSVWPLTCSTSVATSPCRWHCTPMASRMLFRSGARQPVHGLWLARALMHVHRHICRSEFSKTIAVIACCISGKATFYAYFRCRCSWSASMQCRVASTVSAEIARQNRSPVCPSCTEIFLRCQAEVRRVRASAFFMGVATWIPLR